MLITGQLRCPTQWLVRRGNHRSDDRADCLSSRPTALWLAAAMPLLTLTHFVNIHTHNLYGYCIHWCVYILLYGLVCIIKSNDWISDRVYLTPSMPAVPNFCFSKGPAPNWSNPPYLIFDTRRSGAQSWAAISKIKNGGLDQYGKV